MPFINVKMLDGRSQDQKRRLVKALTDAIVEICETTPDATKIIIEEVPREHWASGGGVAFGSVSWPADSEKWMN